MKKFIIAALFLIGCSHTSEPIKQAEIPNTIQSGLEVCTTISSTQLGSVTLLDTNCNDSKVWWKEKFWNTHIGTTDYTLRLDFYGNDNCFSRAYVCSFDINADMKCDDVPDSQSFVGFNRCDKDKGE